jgi:hypothetical protein
MVLGCQVQPKYVILFSIGDLNKYELELEELKSRKGYAI